MLKILFIGDIFGRQGKRAVAQVLPYLIKENAIDFVIAQGENVTNRKGFNQVDFDFLTNCGINAFTMGNHVWANKEIYQLIDNGAPILPPLNSNANNGKGTQVFQIANKGTLRITSLMGITFNKLLPPWKQKFANNFFDALEDVLKNDEPADYNFVDFHAETTSEKNVLALCFDGQINALVGTHTHVQTNDDRTLPKGTAFISDVGMTGPANCAIGANFSEVYQRMRYNRKSYFVESQNDPQFNAVIIEMHSASKNKISKINLSPQDIKTLAAKNL